MLNKRADMIINHYLKYNSKRAMGFCVSRTHAEYMAKYFNDNGIKAVAVYSGEVGEYSEERNTALTKLSSGEIQVIFSVDMFNEGLDIPAIYMVMFLRPTQSPTIFLQQLGRGLRKYKDKLFLTVLDFIGNYKKANLAPFLLSGKNYSPSESNKKPITDYEYPQDCIVDFDFRLVDIFKAQAQREMRIADKVRGEFLRVKDELGHTQSRVELFTYMDDDIYKNIRSREQNPFSNYLEYIKVNHELNSAEEEIYNTRAREFINMIETTSMSKTYKIPILLAFYNNGNTKMEITEEDVYNSFYKFYHQGSNKVDMIRHKATADFEVWDKKKYLKLAKDNPVKFLLKTHSDFFKIKDDSVLALQEDIKEFIDNEEFKNHMKDAIELRIKTYYKNRFFNENAD